MGTRYNRLSEAVITCTHNLCFELNYENSKKKSTEKCHFYSRGISMYIAWECLRNACPCNSDPINPQSYFVKLGFTGVYVFLFSWFDQKYRLRVLVRTASRTASTKRSFRVPTINDFSKKMKSIATFHLKNINCEGHQYNMSVCFIPPCTPLLYSKTGVNRGIHYFLIFALKHRSWVLVRTASLRWF